MGLTGGGGYGTLCTNSYKPLGFFILTQMQKYIQIAVLVVSLLLILAILLQNRGAGLGGVFGGEGNVYRTKRGVEKVLFIATIVLAIAFLGLGVWNFLAQ